MTSDRQTLFPEANASAKHNLMSVGGCADTHVDVDTAGNADGKRPWQRADCSDENIDPR
jgi:hypothetical protein